MAQVDPRPPTAPRSMAELNAWTGQRSEDVIEPALPIIDAHHHMWDRPPERYGLYELNDETGTGHNIAATVFMECTAMYRADGPEHLRPVGETEYVNGVAAMSASGIYGKMRLCAGIVSFADLMLGEKVEDVLQAHVSAGCGRFRGIRYQTQYDAEIGSLSRRTPPPGIMADRSFRAGFARLSALRLSFDAYLYHTQLEELENLAAAYPQTQIVLNHMGVPLGVGRFAAAREQVFAEWSQSILALSRHDNVAVKVGGLGMVHCGFDFHLATQPPSSETLAAAWKPYVETCIDAFGPDRCMFESNFPVDKQSCGYAVLWNAFKRMTRNFAPAEKNALFHGTAARIYRLPLPAER